MGQREEMANWQILSHPTYDYFLFIISVLNTHFHKYLIRQEGKTNNKALGMFIPKKGLYQIAIKNDHL